MRSFQPLRVKFFLRGTHKSKNGQNPIIVRIQLQNIRRDVFSGYYCYANEWNRSSSRLLENSRDLIYANISLDKIERTIHEVYERSFYFHDEVSAQDLVRIIKGKGTSDLMSCLNKELKRYLTESSRSVAYATQKKYSRCVADVGRFLRDEIRIDSIPLQRVNSIFLERYFNYLKGVRKISHNTAIKYMGYFKTLLYPMIRSKLIFGDPFHELNLSAKPVLTEFLTEEQLGLLIRASMKSPDRQRIVDIFIFACFTGLSYCDIKDLSTDHIYKENDGTFYINKKRNKTSVISLVPLLPIATNILAKYSTSKDLLDFQWYVPSNQKMNYRLKEIGAELGIKTKLHMHLARHSFATTVTLSNGVPLESVSAMLGHTTIKQTQHYAKIVAIKVKEDMRKIRNIFNTG